jgi:hypothetical protein
MGAKAWAGGTNTCRVRESTSLVPNRTPPQDGSFPLDESASDQKVAAYSRFSRCRALSTASLIPLG